jgi:LysM repeat protein
MSTPTSPQGSPLEQAAKGNSLAAKITFITLAHLAVIGGGLVFYGCSKDNTASQGSATPTNAVTSLPVQPDPVTPAPFTDTNAIVAPSDSLGGAPTGTSAPIGTPVPAPGAGTTAAPNNPLASTITPLPVTNPEPTPSPTPAPAAGGSASEYKVQKGDVGTTIAKKHGVTVAALKAANPSVNWGKLKVNQTLQIPAPTASPSAAPAPASASTTSTPAADTTEGATTVHVVKANDTLSSISRKYGVPWKQIRAANGLKSENIKIGDKLKIPAKKERAAAKPAAANTPAPEPTAPAPLAPIPTPAPEPSAQPLPPR